MEKEKEKEAEKQLFEETDGEICLLRDDSLGIGVSLKSGRLGIVELSKLGISVFNSLKQNKKPNNNPSYLS